LDFYTRPNAGPLKNPDRLGVREKSKIAPYPEFYYQQANFVQSCYMRISLTAFAFNLTLCPSLPEKQAFSTKYAGTSNLIEFCVIKRNQGGTLKLVWGWFYSFPPEILDFPICF
jgi:hypothetical protein